MRGTRSRYSRSVQRSEFSPRVASHSVCRASMCSEWRRYRSQVATVEVWSSDGAGGAALRRPCRGRRRGAADRRRRRRGVDKATLLAGSTACRSPLSSRPPVAECRSARSCRRSITSLRSSIEASARRGIVRSNAALQWSYDLLPEPERRGLARLSVFVGGFTIAAADAVMDDAERRSAAQLVGRLVDKSLVVREHSGEIRYRLLETVRQFAAASSSATARMRRLDATPRTSCSLAEDAGMQIMGRFVRCLAVVA